MVFNKGYLGNGKYKSQINNIRNPVYDIWHSILERCYHENTIQRFPTYKDCLVSDEWLNFQNFALWYENNIYQIPEEKMCIDKDILYKHNKLYSSETCCIVPNSINMLFTKVDRIRGDYPIGVSLNKNTNRFLAKCKSNNKTVFLGEYTTIQEAFNKYKNYKEAEIKRLAELYKNYIPQNVYDAMMAYQVEITD